MDEPAIKIITRPAKVSDKHFVMATWLKGQYYGSPYFKQMPQDLYYKEYSEHIEQIFDTEGVQVQMACDADNPDWIVGFAVFKEPVLYWIYVRGGDYRNKGIATQMLRGKEITEVKSSTKIGQAIAHNKKLVFNPF